MLKLITAPESKALGQREWRQYLESPLGIIFLIIFLVSIGHLSFDPGRGAFFLRAQADLLPFFDYLPWVMVFFIPAISMRSWAEERKSGTIEFLLTLPVTTTQAVWGKFWASWKFLALALIATLPFPITVFILGRPDPLAMLTGYVGAWLLCGHLLALSMVASALSKSQVTSFILSLSFCVVSLLLDAPSVVDVLNNFLGEFFLSAIENLSLMHHFTPWTKGVVRVSSLLQSLVGISFWLWLCAKIVDHNKSN